MHYQIARRVIELNNNSDLRFHETKRSNYWMLSEDRNKEACFSHIWDALIII